MDAAKLAAALLEQGHSLDLGIMQINSANLQRVGLTVATAFDPGQSIRAGAVILADAYQRCRHDGTVAEQVALRCAASVYNTGREQAGILNGYQARVWRVAAQLVPAIQTAAEAAPSAPVSHRRPAACSGRCGYVPWTAPGPGPFGAHAPARMGRLRIGGKIRSKAMKSALMRSGASRVLLASIALGVSAPAHAQGVNGGGSLTTFINNVANILTGTLGQALAVVAVALIGVGMMFGAFDARRGGMSFLGIAIIFSAAWVVSQITGAGGGVGGP